VAEPTVAVADLQERALDLARVEGVGALVLQAEGRSDLSLSVAIVDDARMAQLHLQFSGVPGPTDVLAFPMQDDGAPPIPDAPVVLGEVVVSADTAAREAEARGLPFERELLLYVVHGTLHLLGYDDHDSAERARMHERQEELLEQFYAGSSD
jgi:probable rRNA maturation factor